MSSAATPLRSRAPRFAEAAVARARLSVVPRTQVRTARAPFVVLVSLLLLGGIVGLLIFNTSMQHSSFTLKALDQKATTLAAREEALTVELEALREPQRFAEAARALGMVMPDAVAFLDPSTGKVQGVRKPAPASDGQRINERAPRRPTAPTSTQQVTGNQAPDTAAGSTD